MLDVDQEFAKNTEAQLTDSDIERARMLVGVQVASKSHEHISRATYDAIRNFALGAGDDNPLFVDEHYGETTRWGSQIAPNSMAQIINFPMLGDPMPAEIKKAAKGLFRGIHVFVSGGTTDWYRPIYPGDRLYSYSGEEVLEEKTSEFAGRSVIQNDRNVKLNQRGEVVAVHRVLRVLTERRTAKDRGKYADIEPASYSDADIAAIDDIYAAETRAATAALLGRRPRRRCLARNGQGPPDCHRGDRLSRRRLWIRPLRTKGIPAGLSEPHPHSRLLHQERYGGARCRPATALGLGMGKGDRQSDGLRLRRHARGVVLPLCVRLGWR